MSSPGAGFEFPSKDVSWQKRDVLLFANSVGCTADELHFLYVRTIPSLSDLERRTDTHQELHPNFSVFPTYPLILREQNPSARGWLILTNNPTSL